MDIPMDTSLVGSKNKPNR